MSELRKFKTTATSKAQRLKIATLAKEAGYKVVSLLLKETDAYGLSLYFNSHDEMHATGKGESLDSYHGEYMTQHEVLEMLTAKPATPSPKRPPAFTDAMPVRTFADGTLMDGDRINGGTRSLVERSLAGDIERRDELNEYIRKHRRKLRRHDAYLKAHGKGGAS